MTRRRTSWMAGSVAAACVAVLGADYVASARRATTDEKIITAARLARKQRDDAVAWVLMAAAAAFLWAGQSDARPLFRPPERAAGGVSRGGRRGADTQRAAQEEDPAFVDEAIARLGRGKEASIPLLQAIQAHYRYLPDAVLRRVCERTEITAAEIAGSSSFYARFRRSPVGEHVVRVCHGTACHVSGARQITDELRRYLAIPAGADTDAALQFTIDEVACVGCCSLAPVMMVDGHPAGKLTPATACRALREPV